MSGPFYTGPISTTWRLFGARRRVLTAAIALRFVQAVFQGIPVWMVIWVVDGIRIDALSERRAVIATVVTVLAVVGQYIAGFASNRFAWVSTFEAIGDARIRALEHVQRLPLGSVQSRRIGDISAVVSSDYEMVSVFAHHALPNIFGGIGLPIIVLISLATIDPPLALAVGMSIAVAVPLFLWLNGLFKRAALERADILATANSRVVEYLHGIAVARAYNQTGERLTWFRDAVGEIRRFNDRLAVRLTPGAFAAIGVVTLGVPITLSAGAYWLFDGRIDAGTVIVFAVLVLRVYAPLIQVATQVEVLRLADASLERIGRIMDLEPQAAPTAPRHQLESNRVEFDHVSFAYDDTKTVLDDMSFAASAGAMTAIVGSSGAGKSTILNLIARFWDVTGGSVRIGGVDVREMSPEQLFDAITIVFQDVYLFQGTVRDNIAFGRPDATDDEVEGAARAAQAHEFIAALPDGYQTRIGEAGATLSGGERQRLSIARAILKDAPVVLLDEATSAVDPINERAIQVALAELVAGRTVVVVAHRLQTIRTADQILVVEDGRIVERGVHDELITNGGRYQRLWSERERGSLADRRPGVITPVSNPVNERGTCQ